jgi:flagellar biosynthesis protein FlhF
MHGTMGNETEPQLYTFRGRSMREAVLQLKDTLGEDAVIQNTQRVRDPRGGYVEITARQGAQRIPVRTQTELGAMVPPNTPITQVPSMPPSALSRALPPQLGSARGPGAYARTAMATTPGMAGGPTQALANSAMAQRIKTSKSGPFAERAAWLASQIEQRQQAEGISPAAYVAAPAGLPPELAALQSGALPTGSHSQPVPMQHPQAPVSNYANVAPLAVTQGEITEDTAKAAPGEIAELRQEIEALKEMVRANAVTVTASEEPNVVQDHRSADRDIKLAKTLSILEAQMSNLVELVQDSARTACQDPTDILAARLQRSGISRIHADDLAGRVFRAVPEGTADDGDVMSTLERFMADDMMCGGAIEPHDLHRRILAFVGPTGVGKTTTVAKVASQARLAGKRVALITVDTCRAAAVEQLARYADVLNAPLKVVKEPTDLTAALDEFSSYDVVLIDTNGRNPRAPDDVSALQKFFKADWGGELVLTLACSTRESDLHASIDAFGSLGIARVCITKVDETSDLGVVYSLARRACRPLTWTTDGQKVPDDIAIAHSEAWSRNIVSELNRRILIAEAS